MLQINMADVIAVLHSLMPYLVAVGVAFALAVIITIAVNGKTVRDRGVRKLVHSQSWLVALIAIVAALSMMLYGPLSTILDNATTPKYTLTSDTVKKANVLASKTQSEAITLLQNNDDNLPLAGKRLNVFGWGSTNPVYGGTGSGSMSAAYPTVSLLDGFKQAGITTNSKLTKLYTSYRKDRPSVSMFAQDWTLPEVPADRYSSSLMDNAKQFSDQAMVVITRVGGEGADLPKDMTAKGITYKNNSSKYADFKSGQHILELSQTERNMIDLVTKNFKKVTLVYNGANAFQFDFLSQYPQIKSVLWCPPAGQTGFSALGDVLTGETDPSGRTSDTFVKDLTKTPVYNNTDSATGDSSTSVATNGHFEYKNMDDHQISYTGFTGKTNKVTPTFINYVEGIYVGYRFYETAADEGLIDYASTVQYPFGYGMSYTSFTQKMGAISHRNGKVSFSVTVKNTGLKAGKDVVQAYYNPPYTNGGLEKSSVNLIAFEKTKNLQPGESQSVSISFSDDAMASYDSKNAKAYVLDEGSYAISIRSDSHTVISQQDVSIPSTITYNAKGNTHDGDKTAATNEFDGVEGNVTYLSRANHFANYAKATAAPTDYNMPADMKAKFTNNGNYDLAKSDKASDTMPTTGAKNGVTLSQLTGKSYNDPLWSKLLDQMSVNDMDSLIANSGYGTPAVKSVGKIALVDLDGPASLNNNFTNVGSVGFPSSTSFACTWNKQLGKEFGEMIGTMAHEMHASGWYAPSQNIHRSAFEGRTFEYFSEDPVLSGTMASSQIQGAKSEGVYAFMKHFALNEQETDRTNMLATWANEQSIREIYLKSFEMSVKQGGAQAVMTSLNYVGPTYSGASSELLKNVLRDEWGFRGFVLTDYFGSYGYQNATQEVLAGNDAMLATTKTTNHVTHRSATVVKAMRQASHNILYTTANSWLYKEGKAKATVPWWRNAVVGFMVATAVLVVALGFLALRKYLIRRNAAKALTDAAREPHDEQ